MTLSHEEKEEFSDESEKVLDHELVQDVIKEFIFNVRNNPTLRSVDPLFQYGLLKIAAYAAQVSRAYALGIDPNDLRNDGDTEHLLTKDADGNILSIGKDGIEIVFGVDE